MAQTVCEKCIPLSRENVSLSSCMLFNVVVISDAGVKPGAILDETAANFN